MKILNILNGDATYHVFKQTNLEGEILIWREILSEGPIFTENLWVSRAEWICKNFGETKTQYAEKVIAAAQKLQALSGYDEIRLWFEYDLVCQINLIFILSEFFKAGYQNLNINLICPEKVDGVPNFRGLGELSPAQLIQLLATKTKLTETDLAFAFDAWNVYAENDQAKIEAFLSRDFGNLPLLRSALKAHLLRFPHPETQLNYIEEVLLEIVNSGVKSKTEIYAEFWAREPLFGMGDRQIDLVLTALKDKGMLKTIS